MSEWIEVVELTQIPVLGSQVIRPERWILLCFVGRMTGSTPYAMPARIRMDRSPRGLCTATRSPVRCTTGRSTDQWRSPGPDEGCTNIFPVKLRGGMVLLQLSLSEEAA